jgi:predicted permease
MIAPHPPVRPAAMLPVRLAAWLVPASHRSEWLSEWQSELLHAQVQAARAGRLPLGARLRFWVRALGAVPDAFALRALRRSRRPLGRDVRDAARFLRRQPVFTLSVVATLALGMGATTAIFSVVDGLLLRPLPFRDPGRLVEVFSPSGGRTVDLDSWSAIRSLSGVFESVRAVSRRNMVLTGAGEARSVSFALLEPGFLGMLGISPILGRDFAAEERVPGRDRVVLLGWELWRSNFGEDPGVIGRAVMLDGVLYTVIGVLPRSLRLLPGGVVAAAAPLTDPPPYSPPRVMLMARLRPGVAVALVQQRLDALSTALARDHAATEANWTLQVLPLGRLFTRGTRPMLIALAGAVTLLLLVACVNAAGLLLVRGLARQSEMIMRGALGATRGALFRQLFIESLLLALMAGAAGTLVAWWGVRGLLALVPSSLLLFNYTTVGVDARVLAFAGLLTLATALLFGLAPALRTSRQAGGLPGGSRSYTASAAHIRLRSMIQVAQLALAVILLCGAGLLGRSFLRLTSVDPGYDPRNLLELRLTAGADRERRATFNRALDERLRALPGVQGVTWAGGQGISFEMTLRPEDRPPRALGSLLLVTQSVDTSYFTVLRGRILEGRGFRAEDLVPRANAVIVDRDLAGLLWPGESAVGRRFVVWEKQPPVTVVGVSGDMKIFDRDDRTAPYVMFSPARPEDFGYAVVAIRLAQNPAALAPRVREVIHELDPARPIISVLTGEQSLGEQVAQPRFLTTVMALFAGLALFLSAIGVYGLIAFAVAQRRHEIGVRMAVGARSAQVVARVLGDGLRLAVAGIVLGLAGALVLVRFIESLLFGVSPLDAPTYAFVALVLALACGGALIVPARRAAAIAPAETLRAE